VGTPDYAKILVQPATVSVG